MKEPVLAAVLSMCCCASAATRLEVTADNSIVMYRGEEHLNAGGKTRIRIKGNQHMVALRFDTRPLAGRSVLSATLVCRRAAEELEGVTVSTIAAPWDEHRSNALTSGVGSVAGWGWEGARFPAVTGGNSFTLTCQSESVVEGDAYHWQVDPDLIHANAVGAAYGLTLHEVSGDYSRNPTVWSREERGNTPHLLVVVGEAPSAPLPPEDLRLTHQGDLESLRLELTAPARGFAYSIDVDGQPLPRWCIPFVNPRARQVIPIRDLKLTPGRPTTVTVTTLNRAGQRSASRAVTASLPDPKVLPLPDTPLPPASRSQRGLAVIPVLDKYDSDGDPVGDLPEDYRWRNAVFDGATIRLAAARGEVTGFQLLLTGREEVSVRCRLAGIRTDAYRAVYVDSDRGRVPDPLVPFGRVQLSPRQATPIVVDVFVPFDFTGSTAEGAVEISDGRRVPIRLRVHGFALPRRTSFFCEMNSYGLPNRMSEFYRLQEIAYDHRVHCNILYYSHGSAAPGARKCVLDKVLDMDGAAGERRMDEKRFNDIAPGATTTYWDDFVGAFGPYLSGECFADGHRGPVPAPGFYLMFHESWPLNVRAFFNGNPDAYEAFSNSPEYARTFTNLVGDFVRLARRQGWTETGFQVYFNNKGRIDDPSRNPWILDEPVAYWDFRALAFYGGLVRRGRGSPCPIRLDYRIDISRPQFDRGILPRADDLWVVNSRAARQYPRLLRDRAERDRLRFWVYGTTNAVEESNRSTQAWVLEAFRLGARGVVPWQTVDKKGKAMARANQLGLFIFADPEPPSGRKRTHHSLRLKAYRRAQQDVEYLTLLRDRLKLTPSQLRRFMDHYLTLKGQTRSRSADDAGTAQYVELAPEAFRRLRAAAAKVLTR